MSVKRDRGADCYCHPQLHSHAMWNFLSDGHCSVKNFECQKRQPESSFTTKPKKGVLQQDTTVLPGASMADSFGNPINISITGNCIIGRRCTKQLLIKLKKEKEKKQAV